MSVIGEPLSRIDGKLKVTGAAKYSAEFQVPNVAYGVLVQSAAPNGSIGNLDVAAAKGAPGVIAVMTESNAPKLAAAEKRLSLLQDQQVHYTGQPIAVVVAESLHQAYYAASLMRPRYQDSGAKLDFEAGFSSSYPGSHNGEPGDLSWGDVESALQQSAVTIDQTYKTPIQHHNPMEPHAAIAQWEGDKLTIYDSTQDISGHQESLTKIFGIPKENVRVISLFIGGAFGCKGQVWSHVVLTAMAARLAKRPVKLVLERPQMFGPVGSRPETNQHVRLGASQDGKLTAISHQVYSHTSVLEDYMESSASVTRSMYACPNVSTMQRLVPLNLGTPTYTRAPGVATGTYALEVAMDELAYKLNMDPIKLRLINYTDVDPHSKLPFTEKRLRECYSQAADKFGWSKRTPQPGSMKRGSLLVGWGMATETYPANRRPSSALVRFTPDGRVLVALGSHEIGNGTYTIAAMVAADALGVSPDLIDVKLGDTILPQAPISAGSMTTASITPAIQAAAAKAKDNLFAVVTADAQSPFHGVAADQLEFQNGKISGKAAGGKSESFSDVIARNGNNPIEGDAHTDPDQSLKNQYASHSFGAVFAEVTVDPNLGVVRVPRVVAVYDVGKLIDEKTAQSQFIGGIIWGIGLALHEITYVDGSTGRILNSNLAEYHVPVNADIGEIDVAALDVPDTKLDPLGARGIGEIGITGTGAAVANAVFHATGKRVRDLPITPDKLIA